MTEIDPKDVEGWRDTPKQAESLDGQLGLFPDEVIKTRRDCDRREFKDRRNGQGFLFDEER